MGNVRYVGRLITIMIIEARLFMILEANENHKRIDEFDDLNNMTREIRQVPKNEVFLGSLSMAPLLPNLQVPGTIPVSPFPFEKKPLLEKFKELVIESDSVLDQEFESFKVQYNKIYSSLYEAVYRKLVFIDNRKQILGRNMIYGLGGSTFVSRINEHADLHIKEFNYLFNGFNRMISRSEDYNYGNGKSCFRSQTNKTTTKENKGEKFVRNRKRKLPVSIDWRELGAVTKVKNQNKCGACYAFSAAAAIESHIFIRTGKLRDLSVQNLIDCTRRYGNDGCAGGLMDPAFEYVRDNFGLEEEKTYPYESVDNKTCRYKPGKHKVFIRGYVDIDQGDEKGLEEAVATVGPVSAAIDANHESFQFYSDGVYFEPNCRNSVENMNHAVLVVGYGTQPDGKHFWWIKNSYGKSWGIGGYMKLAKFSKNHCGIATYASYPLV